MVKIPGMNLLPSTHIFNNTERNIHVRLIGDSQSAVDVRRIKCLKSTEETRTGQMQLVFRSTLIGH